MPLLLLLLLLLFPSFSSSSLPTLLLLKAAVSSDPSGRLTNWTNSSSDSFCHFHGVTCDSSNSIVIALNLAGDGLAGTVPHGIGRLSELRVLVLADNRFSGEIPGAIGKLRLLEVLELQGNEFVGRIPGELCGLYRLRDVDLSFNGLYGPVPEGLAGLRVRRLDLAANRLSGEMKIGSSGSCLSLVYLGLSGNLLVGGIPEEIGECRKLEYLLLDGNILEGSIPAEVGRLDRLRVLDVSRNSLTGIIPDELANCRDLSVMVLTDLSGGGNSSLDLEFNAFVGEIPVGVLRLPNLEVLWAPRANLEVKLFGGEWDVSCKLRVLNLGQNYLTGSIPEKLGLCSNLTFLDLSSNELVGFFPSHLNVGCMRYLNVSHNFMTGSLPDIVCRVHSSIMLLDYLESFRITNQLGLGLGEELVVLHDFSWNEFSGSLQSYSIPGHPRTSYSLFLNNNIFNESFPDDFFTGCNNVKDFSVDLSSNFISGELSAGLLDCVQLKRIVASYNQLSGSIPSGLTNLSGLLHFDLRGNNLTGRIPAQIGNLQRLELLMLGHNDLSGEIPSQLGDIVSITVLDLSKNNLTGRIPPSLANASKLQVLLLDHNQLYGHIPLFSQLENLTNLDVSFNNLSGRIPNVKMPSSCSSFEGNPFLQPCSGPIASSPVGLHFMSSQKLSNQSHSFKLYMIVAVVSASVIVCLLLVLVVVLVIRRQNMVTFINIKKKVVITFTDTPPELNYDNVIKSTDNFSVRNLIGIGGFGYTYKAQVVPGFVVAIKRLSMGRFQGLQQFDAEIRTLGRVRHKNLVTLIGYHMGESDTFLIYNYLSGGNLETFIHNPSGKNVCWPVIHKISLDVAQALSYLHYSCCPRIVHRDIKPSNILLDEKLNAYLSDFGLARLLEVSATHATTDVAGTFGYVAPEYATTCRVSDKADVYSFGIVLLEMISGKKSLDPSFSHYGNGFNIVTWAELLIKEGRSSELFIPKLWEAGPGDNLLGMLKLASSCTADSLPVRPSMKHVVNRLKQLKIY